jgi:GNAT superfamily N-acetyltransferase
MTIAIEPVHLLESQIMEAEGVLARAFFDDPVSVHVLPDEEHRARVLPALMGMDARLGFGAGELYTAAERVEGVAVWIPGIVDFTPEQVSAAGGDALFAEMGDESAKRFGTVMATWGALHHRNMPGPHWYLMLLGVDPPRQGQGIGGQLLQPVLARADADGLPCYLETAKARNVPFYQRHGFEVMTEDAIPDGFRFWTMRRPPLPR